MKRRAWIQFAGCTSHVFDIFSTTASEGNFSELSLFGTLAVNQVRPSENIPPNPAVERTARTARFFNACYNLKTRRSDHFLCSASRSLLR
jgi:hypothetical protein